MDFFDRQDKARRNTAKLVVYFALAVVFLILTIYAVFMLIFSRTHPWNPELLLWVSLGTLAVIVIGSLTKTAELGRGGSAVAEMLGGQLLNPNTTDPDERKLLNVVEEMALASGMQVPAVYLLRNEAGINAFAAGHTSNDAAIGVTQGCIRMLNRDELQGVIAHEFSHILNGDMRLNVRLIGLIFGILCLAVIGRVLLRVRGSGRDRNPLPIIGLALILIGGVGVFFGRLIQAAVSRQREFLADAAAVQFTRNPDGIAGALKKMGSLAQGSALQTPHATEAGHLFFGNGLAVSLGSAFATHPPLTQRIQAIDPSFDGSYPAITLSESAAREDRPAPARARGPFPFPFPLPEAGRRDGAGVSQLAGGTLTAGAVLPTDIPSTVHLRKAAEILDGLSPNLRDALHDAMGASAAIYALLLSHSDTMRRRQLDFIAHQAGPSLRGELLKLADEIQQLPADHRLPLIDLAIAGLRELSPRQYFDFKETIDRLVRMDGSIDLFEYALQRVVMHHLAPQFEPPRKQVIAYYSLKPLLPDMAILLSALAHVGNEEPEQAQSAFQRGATAALGAGAASLSILAPSNCTLDRVDTSVQRLCQAVPQIKKSTLTACAHTVADDGMIGSREAELLRALAATLDCPLPPFVA
ncbi:MAG: M48 family metallopeptidase [Verrucomicrobia bacterium]|jgi:Zn-dependent protease with chaperone function|nr:M48 family metallopeptidase [Verrucomicrobiota bacterium]